MPCLRGFVVSIVTLLTAAQAAASTVARIPVLPPSTFAPRAVPRSFSTSFMTRLEAGVLTVPRFDAELPTPISPALIQVPSFQAVPFSLGDIEPDKTPPLERYQKIVNESPSHLKALDAEQRRKLWTDVYTHKVAGLDDWRKMAKYDPAGVIGFCFGRAMTAHLMARQLGLAEDGIRQVYVTGDLRSEEDPQWRFHVTTLVKGDDGLWYAIDPIMFLGPMSVDQWIAAMHKGYDRRKKARFYLVPPGAALPEVGIVPDLPDETGERLIELSFDPEGKPGFSKWSGAQWPVHELDAERQREHFRFVAEENTPFPFDFLQITINGRFYDYNGYFVDLLRELTDPTPPLFMDPMRAVPPAMPSLGINVPKLGR